MDIKEYAKAMRQKVQKVERELHDKREMYIQTTLDNIHAGVITLLSKIRSWDMSNEYKCTCCDKLILSVRRVCVISPVT